MAAHPLRLPTDEECERFRIDGAVALKGVYQEDWVDLLRQGVERAMQTKGPYTRRIQDEGDPAFFTDYVASDRVPELRRFALEGPAAELSATLMKSRRANFLFDGIFVKEPGATKKSTWHQDQPYYCVAGRPDCRPVGATRSGAGRRVPELREGIAPVGDGVPSCPVPRWRRLRPAAGMTVITIPPMSMAPMRRGFSPGTSNPGMSSRSTA